MKKQSRDRRIENRRLAHINFDADLFEDILGESSVCFSAKDVDPVTGIERSFPLEEVELFDRINPEDCIRESEVERKLIQQRIQNGTWDVHIGTLERSYISTNGDIKKKILGNIYNPIDKKQ